MKAGAERCLAVEDEAGHTKEDEAKDANEGNVCVKNNKTGHETTAGPDLHSRACDPTQVPGNGGNAV
jgi:hypothetical protein